MHIYVIRHAHAVDGDDDAARPLSTKGRGQVRELARFMRKTAAFEAREIWHSPLRRSWETATLLAERLKPRVRVEEVAGLKPDDAASLIATKFSHLRHPVAVVGHEPHLSALASLLVAGRAAPPRFTLKKCSVLRLDRANGSWSVRWLVSPEII